MVLYYDIINEAGRQYLVIENLVKTPLRFGSHGVFCYFNTLKCLIQWIVNPTGSSCGQHGDTVRATDSDFADF